MSPKPWALYMGCVIPNRLPYMELAMRETLRYFEIETSDINGFTCCPNPLTLPHIDHHAALAISARNLAIAEEQGLNLLTPCNGCFEALKGTAIKLKNDKALHQEINAILAKTGHEFKGIVQVKHFIQLLFEDIGLGTIAESVVNPLADLTAAVHVGCHILRPSKLLNVDDAQRPMLLHQLVRALGAKTVFFQDEMDCCGYGTRPADRDLSLQMTANKIVNMKRAGAEALVAICPACTLQFDLMQRLALRNTEDKTPVPVFYYPELLNLALGTPPEKLGFNSHRVKVDTVLAKLVPTHEQVIG
ncbi:MAG: CoB--CoM heterodisulfide reductase iron-sulfur subunit B family protein [Candidatus Hodarchaeota archaeon]